jgi:hypothetical protein
VSKALKLHDGDDAVGSVVTNASPCSSTAAQSDSEAHETALGVPPPGIAVDDQLSGAAACADAGANGAQSASPSASAQPIPRARWR